MREFAATRLCQTGCGFWFLFRIGFCSFAFVQTPNSSCQTRWCRVNGVDPRGLSLAENERESNEKDLLLRLLHGDAAVLGVLLSLHRSRLRRLIDFRLDSRLRGRVDPSDVLQDLFVDAAKRVDHYVRGPSGVPFFVWLRQVLLQRLVEVHRHHLGAEKRSAGRERSVAGSSSSTASVSLMLQAVSRIASPSEILLQSELASQLHSSLASLDPIDREVLVMRHFEELSNDETAAALGLQKSAASNRYVRALERLRRVLERLPDFRDVLGGGGSANN